MYELYDYAVEREGTVEIMVYLLKARDDGSVEFVDHKWREAGLKPKWWTKHSYKVEIPLSETIDVDGMIYGLNASQYFRARDELDVARVELDELKESTKAEARVTYLQNLRYLYRDWCGWNEHDYERFGDSASRGKRKYEQFEELFGQYLDDRTSDPEDVKSALKDKSRWSNPSQYLHDAKRKRGLTTEQLKEHPGFSWIDPKGTSID